MRMSILVSPSESTDKLPVQEKAPPNLAKALWQGEKDAIGAGIPALCSSVVSGMLQAENSRPTLRWVPAPVGHPIRWNRSSILGYRRDFSDSKEPAKIPSTCAAPPSIPLAVVC